MIDVIIVISYNGNKRVKLWNLLQDSQFVPYKSLFFDSPINNQSSSPQKGELL